MNRMNGWNTMEGDFRTQAIKRLCDALGVGWEIVDGEVRLFLGAGEAWEKNTVLGRVGALEARLVVLEEKQRKAGL